MSELTLAECLKARDEQAMQALLAEYGKAV